MLKQQKNKFGFTLIELMVVIVIIGILATLGLVTYRNALIRARDSKAMGDVKDIIAALEQDKAVDGINSVYASIGDGAACSGSITTDFTMPTGSPNSYMCHRPDNNSAVCISVQLENSNNGNCTACNCGASTCTITTGATNTHFCAVTKQ